MAQQPAPGSRMVGPSIFDPSFIRNRYEDIQYGTLPEQKLDLYLPDERSAPLPLIIYIHGGGWCMGSKKECALECIIDALHSGYAVMSIDYRLAPGTKFPEFLFDVKTAVRWARANAAAYGLDPDRFAAMGDSAGGHLSLMVGFTAGRPEYEGEKYGWAGVSSAVQAVVDMYGPAVLDGDKNAWLAESGIIRAGFMGLAAEESPVDRMMDYISTDHDMLALVSPIAYVHKDIPPVLILQGAIDPVVPKQHSTLLAERIDAVCGPGRVDLRLYPERSHSDYAFMNDSTARTAVEFLDRYFK